MLLAGASAWGTFGQVVATYASPAAAPIALARGGTGNYLWVFCNSAPYNIYRVNADTGSVYATAPSPWGVGTRGLSYAAGGYLYAGDYNTDYVYRVHYSNLGSVISSFPTGHDMYGGLSLKVTGDGGAGATAMWASYWPPITNIPGAGPGARSSDQQEPQVYLHNLTTGSIISSFLPLVVCPYDVAWDWRNQILWGAGGPMTGHTPTGSCIGTYWYMIGYSKRFLAGICYDGEYLWAGATWPRDEILKIHCPEGIGVAPASLGKVKALFR
jgi:hypothetical protein